MMYGGSAGYLKNIKAFSTEFGNIIDQQFQLEERGSQLFSTMHKMYAIRVQRRKSITYSWSDINSVLRNKKES